jgi:hypothetical protein
MFLRKNRKSANGEVYEYWTLCETVRTELGPRQRVVATLGKLSEHDLAAGWEDIKALLEGRKPAPRQLLVEFAKVQDLFSRKLVAVKVRIWMVPSGQS